MWQNTFGMRQVPDTQGTFALDTDDVYDRTCQWVKPGGQPTKWTRYRGIFNTAVVDSPKKTPNSGKLKLRIRASDLVGTVYLDDISQIEVGGGGGGGDHQSWTLAGSNDGQRWTVVDSQEEFDFTERSQRVEFSVRQPDAFEFYKLNVANKSGNTLQFGELELLTPAMDRLRGADVLMKSGATVKPGEKYTFQLKKTAPASGEYKFQTRMLQTEEGGEFGQFAPTQPITVTD